MTPNAALIGSTDGLQHELKTCSKCHVAKPRTAYYSNPNTRDKLAQHCKACRIAYMSEYQRRNREAVNAKNRAWTKQWRQENPELAKVNGRERYRKKRDIIRAYHRAWAKEWRRKNPDLARAKSRARYAKNPAYFKVYGDRSRRKNMPAAVRRNIKWRKTHPEKWAEISARSFLSRNSNVLPKMWPQPLVDAVITNRKVKSLCQNQKT